MSVSGKQTFYKRRAACSEENTYGWQAERILLPMNHKYRNIDLSGNV